MNLYFLAVLFFISLTKINCARILAVFPTPSISHQVVFRPLTQELVRRGHDVVVITTDPIYPKGQSPKNLTEIDVHDITYNEWTRLLELPQKHGTADSIYLQVEKLVDVYSYLSEVQLKQKHVQDVIYNNKFDLLLLEACAKSALIYSDIVNAPVILISSLGMVIGNEHIMGASKHPFLYPIAFTQRLYNLTFLEKLEELYKYWWIEQMFDDSRENDMFRRVFSNNAPTIETLNGNIDILLLNTHPLWSNNQPWPPNIISIWGIYKKPSQELHQDLKNYLDSSKNGVIYFSLGTNVLPSRLPSDTIQMFKKLFAKLPYDVLWKWDKDEMPGKSHNIKLFKWLPQSDVLKHPKIKVFITQGGLQSTEDAINAEVPLIGIPIVGDQWYNVEKYVYYKIGIKLDMSSLTEEMLQKAIERAIHDPSIKQNLAKLRKIINAQSETALERAVWWTEYVLRHGGAKHLRSPAANMPWTKYYEIDLLTITLSSILTIVLTILISTYILYLRVISNHFTKVKIKSSNKSKTLSKQ